MGRSEGALTESTFWLSRVVNCNRKRHLCRCSIRQFSDSLRKSVARKEKLAFFWRYISILVWKGNHASRYGRYILALARKVNTSHPRIDSYVRYCGRSPSTSILWVSGLSLAVGKSKLLEIVVAFRSSWWWRHYYFWLFLLAFFKALQNPGSSVDFYWAPFHEWGS